MEVLKVFWKAAKETPKGYFAPLVAFFKAASDIAKHGVR
jgi:hypothetical protein